VSIATDFEVDLRTLHLLVFIFPEHSFGDKRTQLQAVAGRRGLNKTIYYEASFVPDHRNHLSKEYK
jgi:hypothetical protein